MRSLVRRAIVLGLVAGSGVLGWGCEADQATEYVAGISTQVKVPRDLKAVVVKVTVGGLPVYCEAHRVYDGKVLLPRSLGAYPVNKSSINPANPVTYSIIGMSDADIGNLSNPLYADPCSQAKIGENSARVLRRSRQPYVPDDIRFLAMPLKFSCFEKDCPNEEDTCKAGKCVPANTDENTLPRYSPELLDGTGGGCFPAQQCMAAGLPAVTVDAETCTYAVRNTPSAPKPLPGVVDPYAVAPSSGNGVNVQIQYDGGLVNEIVDLDAEEGFFVPDPAFPQRFRLAPGLCEMVKGVDAEKKPTPHRITAIRASGTCQSKKLSQPLCAADQLAAMGLDPGGVAKDPIAECSTAVLAPSPTSLAVIVTDTESHKVFFDKIANSTITEDSDDTIGVAIRGVLSHPALERTTLKVFYAPGADAAGACLPNRAPIISGLAPEQRDGILVNLANHRQDLALGGLLNPVGSERLTAALQSAYASLASDAAAKKAVLVLGNAGFDADTCGTGTPAAAATAGREAGVSTYVIQVTKEPALTANGPGDILASAGGTGQMGYRTAEGDAAHPSGGAKFGDLATSFACFFDEPAASDAGPGIADGDRLAYSAPTADNISSEIRVVNQSATPCASPDDGGEGWARAGGRIVLCKDSCTAYQNAVKLATGLSFAVGQPPSPAPVFRLRGACN